MEAADWLIVAACVAVVISGIGALWLAQPGRRALGMRISVTLFALSLVAALAITISHWSPPAGTVSSASPAGTASLAQVLTLVKASNRIRTVPTNIDVAPAAAVTRPSFNWGATKAEGCGAAFGVSTVPRCEFGDTSASRTMVFYGDSHAQMWFKALDTLAIRDHWKLVLLSKSACPAAQIVGHLSTTIAGAVRACEAWHPYAFGRINRLHPDLLVVTQEAYERSNGSQYTAAQWRQALASTLRKLHAGRIVVLGNIPSSFGPACLLKKPVQECATQRASPIARFIPAERTAARSVGASYVNVTPWFCATRCSPVIGHYDVYFDQSHVAVGYSEYLEGVLGSALGLN